MNMLLNPKIDENKITSRRPLESSFSASFVVDVSKLAHPDDIKKDMYGKWLHSGSHTDVFKCTYSDNDSVFIEKAAPGASGDNVYYLRRLHSVHPSNNDFRRVLALLFGKSCSYSQVINVIPTYKNSFVWRLMHVTQSVKTYTFCTW